MPTRTNQIKMQVPISKDVYSGLQKRAQELGFDSVQAYVRFWAKAEASGRTAASPQSGLRKPEAQAVRYIELLLALNPDKPASVQATLDYIAQSLNNAKLKQALDKMLTFKNNTV